MQNLPIAHSARGDATLESKFYVDIAPKLRRSVKPIWFGKICGSVKAFTRWRGSETALDELSDELVDQFEQESARSFSPHVVRERANSTRRIVRLIDSDLIRPRWQWRPSAGGRRKAKAESKPREGMIRHFYEKVYKPRRLIGRSPNTDRLIVNALRNFRRYLGREPSMRDLTDDSLAGFLAWHSGKGNSPETANSNVCKLMAIARYARRKGFIDVEPEVHLLTCPRRVPIAWTMDDLARLFATIDRLPGRVGRVRARQFWRALLLVIYYTGERIGALLGLSWQTVELGSGWMVVPAELRKGRRADKAFELPPVAVKALMPLRDASRGRGNVFAWTRSPELLYLRLKSIQRRAGLPTDRRSMFHRMRRTAASHYKSLGGDATALLDHSDSRTTQKYLDPRIVRTAGPAEVLRDPTVPAPKLAQHEGKERQAFGNPGQLNGTGPRNVSRTDLETDGATTAKNGPTPGH